MISLRDVVTGFGNRDPLAEVWRRSLRGGGGGSAVITGTPPLRYIGDGRPLTDYVIYGNTLQDGTPTPQNPVMPQGTGERTGNLWDEDYTGISTGLKYVPVFVGEGTFTLSTDTPADSGNAPLFLLSGNVTSGASTPANGVYDGVRRTTDSSNGYITIAFRRQSESTNPMTHKTMLNSGSTALPYEPYGYKIPITCAGQTVPVYLGQTPTVRRIYKYEITGNEDVTVYFGYGAKNCFYVTVSGLAFSGAMCNFYKNVTGLATWISTDNSFMLANNTVRIHDSRFEEAGEFKAFLASQYAAGTPVTVWYVLAEPETGVVNEPLMKIGDYADTISFAQAGVTIPTVSGENVLDVPTEVPPSEVTIKGGISSV